MQRPAECVLIDRTIYALSRDGNLDDERLGSCSKLMENSTYERVPRSFFFVEKSILGLGPTFRSCSTNKIFDFPKLEPCRDWAEWRMIVSVSLELKSRVEDENAIV